jgi:hypothetical protein
MTGKVFVESPKKEKFTPKSQSRRSPRLTNSSNSNSRLPVVADDDRMARKKEDRTPKPPPKKERKQPTSAEADEGT